MTINQSTSPSHWNKCLCEQCLYPVQVNMWMSDGCISTSQVLSINKFSDTERHKTPVYFMRVRDYFMQSKWGCRAQFRWVESSVQFSSRTKQGTHLLILRKTRTFSGKTFSHHNLPVFQWVITLFQQDGATSHTARISINAVNALFPGHVISRNEIALGLLAHSIQLLATYFYEDTLKSVWSRSTENHWSPQTTICG